MVNFLSIYEPFLIDGNRTSSPATRPTLPISNHHTHTDVDQQELLYKSAGGNGGILFEAS